MPNRRRTGDEQGIGGPDAETAEIRRRPATWTRTDPAARIRAGMSLAVDTDKRDSLRRIFRRPVGAVLRARLRSNGVASARGCAVRFVLWRNSFPRSTPTAAISSPGNASFSPRRRRPARASNLSPRGTDAFAVLDDHTVAYLDRTGSGNETAAHLRADGRLTVMFCAFDGPPNILRLYGMGEVLLRGSERYRTLLSDAFESKEPAGARQIVLLRVDRVQTSCGYGVPLFDYRGERPSLDNWARSKGRRASKPTAGKRTPSASTGCRRGCLRRGSG